MFFKNPVIGAFPNVYKVGSWKKQSHMRIRLLMQVIALFLRSRLKSPPCDSKAQVNGKTGESKFTLRMLLMYWYPPS